MLTLSACDTGFSVEQLMRNSPIEMVCGISRMKSQKREQLSVSCVLMKSLSSVSTTGFGRFSWLVVQQHSQRWVTFILKFPNYVMSSRKRTFILITVHYLKCAGFVVGTEKECSFCKCVCMWVCSCLCTMHFFLPCSTNDTLQNLSKVLSTCWCHISSMII
jgi:hypothetical protein